MKSDLDVLMDKRNLDALVVLGDAENNPPMYYLTGGGHISAAILVKLRGKRAVLYCGDMERDEAAKTGLEIRLLSQYPRDELMKEAGGDSGRMDAIRFQRIMRDLELTRGRVGLYGKIEASNVLSLIGLLGEYLPDVEFVGDNVMDSVFLQAMETKSDDEVNRIREIGRRTTEVVGLTAEYLTSCAVRDDEVLLNADGTPLCIRDVKRRINLWLAERELVPSEGFIFAIGRDAGVPHSQGNPEDLLRLGQTIIFDIYPQEAGGGYFFDFTRTWSLGYATPDAQKIFDQVQEIYLKVIANMDLNAPFKKFQRMACEYFESKGHKSLLNTPSPKDGYVHSLGHGVGINIHERPFSSLLTGDDHRLAPGVVIAVEPGLYYPEKGMGVRIEDTYWVRPDGTLELMAQYSYDFVLPLKEWKQS